jgi:hypothetical protein
MDINKNAIRSGGWHSIRLLLYYCAKMNLMVKPARVVVIGYD